MRERYDIDISDSTISRITDKILPIVKEWQECPLEEVYAIVFMDVFNIPPEFYTWIHFKSCVCDRIPFFKQISSREPTPLR